MQQERSIDSTIDRADEVALNPRRPAHACERCRLRHQRCNIGPDRIVCSNCERASAECTVKRNTELRIRFSKVEYKQPKRRVKSKDGFSSARTNSPAKRIRISSEKESPDIPGTGTITWNETPSSSQGTVRPEDFAVSQVTFLSGSPERIPRTPGSSGSENHVGLVLPPLQSTPDSSLGQISPVATARGPRIDAWPHADPSVSRGMYSPLMNDPCIPCCPRARENTRTTPLLPPLRSAKHTEFGGELKPGLGPLAEEEAELMKYFFKVLASWFDFCDPETQFRNYVASKALEDTAVLYAVLAVSARHREVMTGTNTHKSSEYERLCLEILIPSLSDTTNRLQESVLAPALLIRLLEEMTEPNEGETISQHAVSASILLQIKQGNLQPSKLSDSAMIVALRQELFVANMMKRAVQPIADHCNVDRSLEPTSDAMWTYRIIAHAARVTNFVYGTTTRDTLEWDRLWQYLLDWDHRKPVSFRPMYYKNCQAVMDVSDQSQRSERPPSIPKDGCFPKLLFTYDCPVAGQQYLQLCRILLLAHDPRTPVLGLGRAEFLRKQEEEIRDAVRIICGIGESNLEYWPAKSTAGLVIAMCGELFSEPQETQELLRIVSEAEHHLGWPCLKVSYKLKRFWNLEKTSE